MEQNTSPDSHVTRDVAVGRNTTIGGNANVRGNVTVDHDIRVKGRMLVDNINFPTAGVFPLDSEGEDELSYLKAEYPNPKNGMIAGVFDLSGITAVVYLCYSNNHSWVKTEITLPVEALVNYTTEGVAVLPMIETLQTDVAGKADKLAMSGQTPATENNFMAINANGNPKDSGKGPDSFVSAEEGGILELQTAYFAEIREVSSGDVVSGKYPSDIYPDQSKEKIYYDSVGQRFLAYDSEGEKYYTQWDFDGAYMGLGGSILMNKLYLAANGQPYYCLLQEGARKGELSPIVISTYAVKNEMSVTPGTGADADKVAIQLQDGLSATVLTSHQDVSGKANKSEMTVSEVDGVQTITLKSGHTARAYTPSTVNELLGRAVGEAVRCTYHITEGGKVSVCSSSDLLLAVVDGVGYLPDEDGDLSFGFEEALYVVISFVFKNASVIPAQAFQGRPITDIHIPSFVREIASEAFGSCNLLEAIDCEGLTPPDVTNDPFDGVTMSGVTLTVHEEVERNYIGSGVNWAGVGRVIHY